MGRVWIVLVLLCLLNGALVEAVPELTLLLRGKVIPENEVLDKEDLGTDEAGALSVVTPYSGDISFHYPHSDLRVPNISGGYFWISSTGTFSNDSRIIRLTRREEREQSDSQEGVWRCSVPSDANGGRWSIYFGLYTRRFPNRGVLNISSGPNLTAVSSLLTEPPTYTLTANTTGGPPGNVNWKIDGAAIPNSTATANVVNRTSISDRLNARYTHTLMVRGRQSGVIRFTASNNRTSPARSGPLTITFPDPPTNVQASQVGEGRVQVTWNRPTSTIDGFSFSLNGEPPTDTGTTTRILSLATGSHDISVASRSLINGQTLYSATATDTVEVLALPTPTIMSLTQTSTSVRVEWTLSSGSGNKSPDEISITYTRTSCPPEDADSVTTNDGSLRMRDIDGLAEFSTYTVRVTAVYRFGGSNPSVMKESGEVEVQTLPAAPSSAPQGLSVQSVMATSVMLTWNELACLQQNGDITGYMIQYVGNSQTITNSSSDASTTYTVQGLDPFTEYSFSVAAVNSNGTGPFSEQPLTIRTAESTPGVVDLLTLTPKFTSVKVTWSTPARPNGIITMYQVTYTINASTTVNTTDNTTFEFTISSLEPGTGVKITVRAFTSIGVGEPITITNSTLAAPPPVSNVQVDDIGTTGTGGSSCPTLDTTTLTPRCQCVGAVIGTAFAVILLYTVTLLIVLLVCFYWRKQQSTYSVQVKSEQQQREQPDQEGRVYDVIEPADKGTPMKQCAAYGDVHTRQQTGDPQDVGIYI